MKFSSTLSIVAIACALAACGGGGGGSDSGNTSGGSNGGNPPTTTPETPKDNYPVVAQPGNYVDANRNQIFDAINKYRTGCGFSAIKQNSLLDTAAQGHANYTQVNSEITHIQSSNKVGFTGKNIGDRIIGAGYQPSIAGEIVGSWLGGSMFQGSNTNGIEFPKEAPTGTALLNRLFSTVYHLAGAMDEWNDMGVGYSVSENRATAQSETNFFSTAVVNFANSAGSDVPHYTGGKVRTFPCEGVEGVSPIFTSENPNPFPAIDFNMSPMGTPVFVQAPNNGALTIESSQIIKVSTGAIISTALLDSQNDPHKSLKLSQGFIIPSAPLDSNTQYRVKVKGLAGTDRFSYDFVFKTGTQN